MFFSWIGLYFYSILFLPSWSEFRVIPKDHISPYHCLNFKENEHLQDSVMFKLMLSFQEQRDNLIHMTSFWDHFHEQRFEKEHRHDSQNGVHLIELTYRRNATHLITKEESFNLSTIELPDFSVKHIQSYLTTSDYDYKSHCITCNIMVLNLHRNQLQVICNASFSGFPNLQMLDLSFNMITTIEGDAFAELTGLQKLHLNGNRLNGIPANSLWPLRSLIILNLNNNEFTDDILQAFKFKSISLIELQLQGNSVTTLCAALLSLQNLEKMNLSNNKINKVCDSFFHPMKHLTELDLSNNSLSSLPENILSENVRLKKLNLSSNQMTSVSNFNCTSLETLILTKNHIGNITLTDRRNICNLRDLKTLKLNFNTIQTSVPDAFSCMTKNMAKIDLRHNALTSIVHVLDQSIIQLIELNSNNLTIFSFSDFSNEVSELDMNKNQIRQFQSSFEILNRPMILRRLRLSNNQITDMSNVTLPPNLKVIDLSNNRIKIFSFVRLSSSGAYAISPKLKYVKLSSNSIRILCPTFHFLFNEGLKTKFDLRLNPLICSSEMNIIMKKYNGHFLIKDRHHSNQSYYSKLEFLNGNSTVSTCRDRLPTNGCPCHTHTSYSAICNLPCPETCVCYVDSNFTSHLINCSNRDLYDVPQLPVHSKLSLKLDLSANHFEVLDKSMLVSYLRASEIYLNKCRMTEIAHNALWNLTRLKILNLEENSLERLDSELFINLTNLTELYLAKNHLNYLPSDIFQPLTSLKVLQLHCNLLTNFSRWKFQAQTALSSLTLGNNPWNCDCDHVEKFRSWFQKFSPLVKDTSDLYCLFEDDTNKRHFLLSFNYSRCHDGSQVYLHNSAIQIWPLITGLAIFGFLSLVSVLLFIYRHETQVLLYSRYSLRLFRSKRETEEDKMYDAFLAYCSHDAEFVFENLVPGLEKIKPPYKLCIHERDFLAGAIITESILEAVQCSHRTIIVLTQNFVNSGWCVFEFKSAHFQMLSDRCNRIIIILVGDAPQNIDREMKLYLKTHTYLKWGDNLFWQKLYFSMPDQNVPKTHLEQSGKALMHTGNISFLH